jgi:integrase
MNGWNPKTEPRYMHRPRLMRTLCKRAGVRHFGFHAIRHYVASYLADKQKVSITQVSHLLRHQTKATTDYLPGGQLASAEGDGDSGEKVSHKKKAHGSHEP